MCRHSNMSYTPTSTVDCDEVDSADENRRQLSAASTFPNGELDKSMEHVPPSPEEIAKKRFSGACHPNDGCAPGPSAAHGRLLGERRELARRSSKRVKRVKASGNYMAAPNNRAGSD